LKYNPLIYFIKIFNESPEKLAQILIHKINEVPGELKKRLS